MYIHVLIYAISNKMRSHGFEKEQKKDIWNRLKGWKGWGRKERGK